MLPPASAQTPLGELVEKCYALGPFPALWAVEGLGHYYGDACYARNESPQDLLTKPELRSLPAKSLTMLHAGIGLSFAQHSLDGITARSAAADVRRAVETTIELCRSNSQLGYAGAAIESLGLVSRWLHDLGTLRAVDEQLAAIAPDLVGYLWHGAGRAVYFSPPNFVPGLRTPWRAVEMCQREAPHDIGRRNLVAGFAWAVTLVNMGFPLIMETVLKYHGEQFAADDAFSNGIASSIMMRYDTSPDDPTIANFLQYRPAGGDSGNGPKLASLWDRLVKRPTESAMLQCYPILKENRRMEEVFHYQDLASLVRKR